MNYQDSTGRSSEVMFGIITFFIALIFFALVLMIMTNASLSLASVGGSVVLAAIGGWFAQLSYRLVLHKPRTTGGLLSPFALKFWCVFFGVTSCGSLVFALITAKFDAAVGAAVMLPACWYGWKLADHRQRN
jgi:membrane associated rhomboid family serine protease